LYDKLYRITSLCLNIGGLSTQDDPRRSNIGGRDPCNPCGVDAYGREPYSYVTASVTCGAETPRRSYTVILLLTFIFFIISIPSPHHSFIPGLKSSFLQILPCVAFFFFSRTEYMDSPDCLLILLSTSVFYFYFFLFSVGSVR